MNDFVVNPKVMKKLLRAFMAELLKGILGCLIKLSS